MFTDYLINQNGSVGAHGQVAGMLQDVGFDPGVMRPYWDSRGQRCVTIKTGRVDNKGKAVREKRTVHEMIAAGITPAVFNSTSLSKDQWIELDRRVIMAARQRLRAWADLAAANTYGGFDGFGTPLLEHETMSDPGEAMQDMEGMTEGRTDSPLFQLEGLPLPITHSDFYFSLRRLRASRRNGTPLDMRMAEAAGRRVAELIEQTTIGTVTGLSMGLATANGYSRAASVYGYTNFPPRITKTDLTTPTGSNPEAVLQDILEMRSALYDQRFYGPFMVYHSTAYDTYLDNDYFRTGGTSANMSLRQRILATENIAGLRRLDFLTSGYVLIMVQMTSDVARAVNGQDITVIQWESQGGMRLNFKVLAIQVPQLFADFNGRCGILHGTTS